MGQQKPRTGAAEREESASVSLKSITRGHPQNGGDAGRACRAAGRDGAQAAKLRRVQRREQGGEEKVMNSQRGKKGQSRETDFRFEAKIRLEQSGR